MGLQPQRPLPHPDIVVSPYCTSCHAKGLFWEFNETVCLYCGERKFYRSSGQRDEERITRKLGDGRKAS